MIILFSHNTFLWAVWVGLAPATQFIICSGSAVVHHHCYGSSAGGCVDSPPATPAASSWSFLSIFACSVHVMVSCGHMHQHQYASQVVCSIRVGGPRVACSPQAHAHFSCEGERHGSGSMCRLYSFPHRIACLQRLFQENPLADVLLRL